MRIGKVIQYNVIPTLIRQAIDLRIESHTVGASVSKLAGCECAGSPIKCKAVAN